MVIRAYDPADQERLFEIFVLNTPRYFAPEELKDYCRYLDQHAQSYLTVELNSKVVGGVGYGTNIEKGTGHVAWIFFDPNHTGNGIGSKAVQHCHEILSQDKRIHTFEVRTSQLAYLFFEKFGYKTITIVKDYWAPGLDLYEMEMPI